MKQAKFFLSFVVVSLCFFAFFGSWKSFESDEALTLQICQKAPWGVIAELKRDVHPPLYFLLLAGWQRIVGQGEVQVRALSAIFFVLGVLATFGVGRRLYGAKPAMIAAAVYMTSPLALIAAQFARMYALLSLLSVVATWLYVDLVETVRPDARRFWLLAGVSALGTFTHVWFFFLLFGMAVAHVLVYRWKRLWLVAGALALSVVPYIILWLPVLLAQLGRSREALAWAAPPTAGDVGEVLLLFGGVWWTLVPALGFYWWKKRPSLRLDGQAVRHIILPLLLLLVSLGTPFLISFWKPVFYSRFTIIGLHLFALAAGAAIGEAGSRRLAAGMALAAALGWGWYRSQPATCEARWSAEYLLERAKGGDVVVFTNLSRPAVDYYLAKPGGGKELARTTFPAEIDSHPGYEGRVFELSRAAALREEAVGLANRIQSLGAARPGLQVFFFHGFRPATDAILKTVLDHRFELCRPCGVECPDLRNYHREITVYKVRAAAP